jgi:hypothetical protein
MTHHLMETDDEETQENRKEKRKKKKIDARRGHAYGIKIRL